MFTLHPQLQRDTLKLGEFELSRVLLMNDARYPWLILVPRREDIQEIHQLDSADQQQLLAESSFVAQQMSLLFKADKMNIAALGNMVPQLHLHHIARFSTDACWPNPVWGIGQAQPYAAEAADQMLARLRAALATRLAPDCA